MANGFYHMAAILLLLYKPGAAKFAIKRVKHNHTDVGVFSYVSP